MSKTPAPKFVRAKRRLAKVVASIERETGTVYRVLFASGATADFPESACRRLKFGEDGNTAFNAAYQRHLRKLDADKIRNPKK